MTHEPHLGAGPQPELAQDDPVPQGELGVIARRRQCRVLQHLEDGLPIIESLHSGLSR